MHHDGFNAQFAAGALDTESDLAAIGDQDFFKHGVGSKPGRGAKSHAKN
jgi:hypothetical protein